MQSWRAVLSVERRAERPGGDSLRTRSDAGHADYSRAVSAVTAVVLLMISLVISATDATSGSHAGLWAAGYRIV